ncbi:hypothetical protein COV11_03835 [Candidatus Woesearchaeota archaeon CG10_big_fil_rev_8_21_14_0_10_30_7]|nr:MAG: hypothetical protein COV11_03835 [Candidatus Woesearchaeota archaeon CG10_big_fil_rev_8_21_14_0_10_30_7]
MKHPIKPTIFLLCLFFVAQIIGLLITNAYLTDTGWMPLPNVLGFGVERPDLSPSQTVWTVLIAILAGTFIFLAILKWKFFGLIKVWFFLALMFCLHIAFGAFIPSIPAFFLAIFLTSLKLFKNNFFVHNFTELFIYGGLASIFIPLLTVLTGFILLILISIYDMYAVWQSKHMIHLAEAQAKQGIFAGLALPYKLSKLHKKSRTTKQKLQTKIPVAILGGGDIGFPLMFTGALFVKYGWSSLIIIPFSTLALALLFFGAKKNKFYPAMPFISFGCFVGFLFQWFFLL